MDNNEKDKKIEDFSADKGNVEIVKKEESQVLDSATNAGSSVSVSKDGINVKKSGNLVIGSLNIVASPIKETLKTRHEKHYRSSKFHLISDLALALLIIGLFAAFLIIRNFEPQVDIGLEAQLVGESATSGDIETFEIEYNNPSDMPVANAGISMRFPRGFIVSETYPAGIFNSISNTFEIGSLPAGAGGKVKIEGLVVGEVGSRQVINISFNYSTGNKMQNILDSLVYLIEDSSLKVSADMPKEAYKNVPFRGQVIVGNSGTYESFEDLEIVFKSSVIKINKINFEGASLNNNAITLSALPAGERAVVDFEAEAFLENESAEVAIETYVNAGGNRIKQGELKKVLNISIPKFTVGITADKTVISEGESVNFTLDYENKEGVEVSGARILFGTSDSAFKIDGLAVPENPKYRIAGNELVFLSPIKDKELGSIKAQASFGRKNISANQEAGLTASIDYNLRGNQIAYKAYSAGIKFLSDLQVASRGVYYSAQGDQLGIGPLPPIVDVPTRFWIFWEVDNIGNKLENMSVSAVLPENAYWTNQKSLVAGKVRYGEATKKVVWSLDEVALEGGEYRAGFEVELIPVAADIGQVLDILKDIKFSAFDTFAQREIEGNLPAINTNLKDDSVAYGQGTVQKMNVVR